MFGADAGFAMLGTVTVRWLFGGGFSFAAGLAVFFITLVVALTLSLPMGNGYRASDRLLVVRGFAISAACVIPFVVLGSTAGVLLADYLAHGQAQFIGPVLGTALGFSTGAVVAPLFGRSGRSLNPRKGAYALS